VKEPQFVHFNELYSTNLRFGEAAHSNEGLIYGLVALVNSAYRGDSSKKGWTTEADFLDGQRTDPLEIQKLLEHSNESILGYLNPSQEAPLACVRLRRDGTNGYLGMLTVSPTLQAQGMGRKLLESAEVWAKKNWHIEEMHMTVISIRTELIDWYIRRGYTLTNEFQPFPYGDERFGIPLRKDLRFQILRKKLTGNTKP
jgi:GNAT superfamily N-acetyltransferase